LLAGQISQSEPRELVGEGCGEVFDRGLARRVDGADPPVAPMLAVTMVDRAGRADARRTWSPTFEKSIRSRTGQVLAFWILTSRPSREVGACDGDMDTAAAGADPPMLVIAPMLAVTAVDRAGSRQCSTDVVDDV
jgi:hypothetical protein